MSIRAGRDACAPGLYLGSGFCQNAPASPTEWMSIGAGRDACAPRLTLSCVVGFRNVPCLRLARFGASGIGENMSQFDTAKAYITAHALEWLVALLILIVGVFASKLSRRWLSKILNRSRVRDDLLLKNFFLRSVS